MSVSKGLTVLELHKYCKILITSPGLVFVQKVFLLGLFWGELNPLFSKGLIIGRNFAFQNGFDLTIKTA